MDERPSLVGSIIARRMQEARAEQGNPAWDGDEYITTQDSISSVQEEVSGATIAASLENKPLNLGKVKPEELELVEHESKVPQLDLSEFDEDEESSLPPSSSSVSSGGESTPEFTAEERLKEFADQLLAGVLRRDSDAERMRSLLYGSAKPELFREENYILFKILFSYRNRGVILDEEFLRLFLIRNRSIIEQAKGYITPALYGEIDGDDVAGYISGILKHFNRLLGFPKQTYEEYSTVFEKYLIEFQAVEAEKVYENSIEILTNEKSIKHKVLTGFKDSFDYTKKSIAEIEGLVDSNMGKGFLSLKELLQEAGNEEKPVLISDWGTIDELNHELKGVYTSTLYTILAPPKAGKSKFCTRMAHNALLNGVNISVWAQEGGMVAWAAQLRAIHFDYVYNRDKTSVKDRIYGIDQGTILYDKFLKPQHRDMEAVSKEDLLSNISYGNIDFIDRPFQLETFMDDIDTSVKANNSKLVIIDYMQLLGTQNYRKSKREVLSEAYPILLDYTKKNNIAIVSPAQYSQESVKELDKSSDVLNKELRTSGGESSEIIRSSDIILALWASTEDLRHGEMSILSIPARFNRAFDPFSIYVDLGSCNFISKKAISET